MAFGLTGTSSLQEALDRAADPATVRGDLATLSLHRSAKVRAVVASRADTPTAALISLAHDGALEVLSELVANPAAPVAMLRMLSTHRHSRIKHVALARAEAQGLSK